jgi:hypothetical protein
MSHEGKRKKKLARTVFFKFNLARQERMISTRGDGEDLTPAHFVSVKLKRGNRKYHLLMCKISREAQTASVRN